jgi:hypothetical protein
VTSVQDQGGGNAIVEWETTGKFPSGFVIVWSMTNQFPTYPVDQYIIAGDSAAHSAMISADMNKILYLRVCRLSGDRCDVYSTLKIFALTKAGATPVAGGGGGNGPAVLPTAYNSGGGVINSSTSITITGMSSNGSRKAQINWTGVGTFSSGFKIVYSTSSANPYVGGYPYYSISNSSTRIAYVDGKAGTKYYYRVCRVTGTTCDIYSNSYSYTFPGTAVTSTPDSSAIHITSITDTTTGKAAVNWSASGSFPNGFKILYSSSHSSPTLNDTHVSISDGSLRTGIITGTPGTKYYVRVCKYDGSSCEVYSPTVTFTFNNAPDAIVLTSIVASDTNLEIAKVSWTATGSFPSGFKLLYSQTNTDPTLSDGVVTVSSSAARTATFSGSQGTTYHVRLCKYISGDCDIYSNTLNYTFPGDASTINITSLSSTANLGEAIIQWNASGNFPNGFKILASQTRTLPLLGDTLLSVGDGSLRIATITQGIPGTTYHFRICKYYNSLCSAYSTNTMDVTFTDDPAIINIPSVTDSTPGNAIVNWTATTTKGDFSGGFKILASTTNTQPTLADVVASAGVADSSATISGTPDTNYYIRVCKYFNGGCSAYSNTYSFTFAP